MPKPTTPRRPLAIAALGLALAMVGPPVLSGPEAAAAVPPPGSWYVPKQPQLLVRVAAGCPSSVRRYRDVVNTFPGPPLVPPGPSGGLICWYGPPPQAPLARQTRLESGSAQALAAAVRRLDLSRPVGVFHCPAAFGTVAVIGLSYPGRPDVGLWYAASGCQTLDNGHLGSFQGGNPSFYNDFQKLIDKLSPPVSFT